MIADIIIASSAVWACSVLVNFIILLSAIVTRDDAVLASIDCRTRSFLFAAFGLQAMIGHAAEQRLETEGRWHLTFLVATALGAVLFPNSPLWLLRVFGPTVPWALFAALSSLALSFPIGAVLLPTPNLASTDLRTPA